MEGAYYLLHCDRVSENVRSMREAFQGRYKNTFIAYSLKTNYLRRIIELCSNQGCIAEVVSPYELRYAEDTGIFSPTEIIYNGVIPDAYGKYSIAASGGIVNVDNYEEYTAISRLTHDNHNPITLGVRLNVQCSNGVCSRFGVDVSGDEFLSLMNEITNDDMVTFGGFHCHIGLARPLKFWAEKAINVIEYARQYDAQYIDLGGGMYGPMVPELAEQFDEYVQSFDQYAACICGLMKEQYPDESVRLIIEPGTAIVGNAMDLVCHVTNIKDVRGQTYVTVDTSSNHLGMICECRRVPLRVIAQKNVARRHVHNATICGCTCLEFDYILKGYMGDIAVGDTLLFENVGAYSLSEARNFIIPALPVYDAQSFDELCGAPDCQEMFVKYNKTPE